MIKIKGFINIGVLVKIVVKNVDVIIVVKVMMIMLRRVICWFIFLLNLDDLFSLKLYLFWVILVKNMYFLL